MTKREELQMHLNKQKELRVAFEKARGDLIAFNKMFDAWLQGAIGKTEHQGEIHLAEILTEWDKVND